MDITAELVELYAAAKSADKFDLAFRILAHLDKTKRQTTSIATLSDADLSAIIEECENFIPENIQNNKIEIPAELINPPKVTLDYSVTHAHTQAKVQPDPPP